MTEGAKGPRPEGLWRAKVHGEFTVVDLVRETCGDGSCSEAVDARLAGYGWIEGWDFEKCRVELLEPIDPSRPLGGLDRGAVRAMLRARRPEGLSPEPGVPPPAMAVQVPHLSHDWQPGDPRGDGREPAAVCARCLALADEPPGWAPCRVADGAAKMAEAVGGLTREGARMLTLADPAEVPRPPAGRHMLGAVDGVLGCVLCGKRASSLDYEGSVCPANP